jgi:hypothetical protein
MSLPDLAITTQIFVPVLDKSTNPEKSGEKLDSMRQGDGISG